ncbi:MAG: hypothetical protein AMJ90_01635 [candidate division Zixibacteria bacterium SM23_73_2]|nr:MAG: hypothetical protein AMJ90_01635 [candidate division Zixibacteria bacterium SM23_73_2]
MPFKIKTARFVKTVYSLDQLPKQNFPQIVFAGRSNVGKSSLINTLVGQKNLAKTSSTPGKTVRINFFLANENIFLVDLPGYGYAKTSKKEKKVWGALIEEYLKEAENLKGVIQIMDIRHPPFESDLGLLEFLSFYNKETLVILTKSDKLTRSKMIESQRNAKEILKLNENSLVTFSAKTKKGKDQILKWIGSLIKK